jgi:hypothetical protein
MREDTSGKDSESARSELTPHLGGDPMAAGEIEPEFESAISRGAASFFQLAQTYFYAQEKFNRNPHAREIYQRYQARLAEAFEAAHGPITYLFYCRNRKAGAVLTGGPELWVIHPPFDEKRAEIADILLACDRLNIESDRVLSGPGRSQDLRTTKRLLYAIVVRLLAVLDTAIQPARRIMDLYRDELGNARDYYLRAAARHAKFDYFLGMLIGVVLCLAVIASSASFPTRHIPDPVAFVGSLTAGAIGAVVSVLSRMTFGELALDHEAGRPILTMLGAFRPVIGMVFGAAMWVLSESNVLGIGPTDQHKMLYFHILIAFLAGFSERWAQDMLGRASDQISGRDGIREDARAKVEQTAQATSDAKGGT